MKYSFDKISLLKNNKRWFPVMGEMHYSRVPSQYWREGLYKMKAGGVDITGTYVIWIHHEEIEGEWDWSEERDLKGFLQAAKDCDMKILLRIGPWCHGEVRNGGFPDWLLQKSFEVRTNDSAYFEYVKKFYSAIYEQAKDYLCTDNNDNVVIGIQIENEYGHCGGLYTREDGEKHMQTLLQIAKETGFNVPLYTATGWGGAWTGGMIPVMGGYCDAPWDQRITEIEPSGNYTFTHERNDHNIGSDHGFGYGITFDIDKFPFLTAELGGGLQVTSHRRTVAKAPDVAAEACVKLGCGVNLLGFYMYHGGTNPEGKLTTLQESKATGYLNDLPVKSYDFRAPVREFGAVSDTLRELKLLSYFVNSYGEDLCELPAVINKDNPLDPCDLKKLRYAYRSDGKKGYVFVNNYVRLKTLECHKNVLLTSPDLKTTFKSLTVNDKDFFFLPFNMQFGKNKLKTAYVTPFVRTKNLDVFYTRCGETNDKGFFDSEGQPVADILVLTRKQALNTWKAGKEHLIMCDSNAYVIQKDKDTCYIIGRGNEEFYVYPSLSKTPESFVNVGQVNMQYAKDLPSVMFDKYTLDEKSLVECGSVKFVKTSENTYCINVLPLISKIKDKISDVFVSINYTGESCELYCMKNGERVLLLDNFYTGESYPWEIGLKRFINQNIDFTSLELVIKPLSKDAKIYLERWPQLNEQNTATVNTIKYEVEWKYEL